MTPEFVISSRIGDPAAGVRDEDHAGHFQTRRRRQAHARGGRQAHGARCPRYRLARHKHPDRVRRGRHSAGAVALVPTPLTAVSLGLALFAAGCAIVLNRVQQWILLGQICLVIGALMFGGGVVAYGAGSLASMLIVTGSFALAAIAARSSLLMALAVLAASACLGARTGYSDAVYSLAIFEPTLTVVLFSALALIAYQASQRLPADYERLAITAARTSLLLINFGFWIGSLWGDPLMLLRSMNAKDASLDMTETVIPATVFSILWAVVLLGAGIWAVQVNRRWLVNLVALFAGI